MFVHVYLCTSYNTARSASYNAMTQRDYELLEYLQCWWKLVVHHPSQCQRLVLNVYKYVPWISDRIRQVHTYVGTY